MTEFVTQYYRMDPETEEAIFGKDLTNGMVVLIEAPSRRADLQVYDPDLSPLQADRRPPHIEYQALRMNRWAKVTMLQHLSKEENKVPELLFIAEYEDGLRATQSSYMTTGWLVKKDSMTSPDGFKIEGATPEARENIRAAMLKRISEVRKNDSTLADDFALRFLRSRMVMM